MIMMKRSILTNIVSIFSFVLAFNIVLIAQVTYYVDATLGNDANSGLTPQSAWKTLNKVNTFNLQPGNSVALKRGEVWREKLTLNSSSNGNPNAYIKITAYGEGKKPQINHADLVIGNWTNIGNNVWSINISTTIDNDELWFGKNDTIFWGYRKSGISSLTQDFNWYQSGNLLYVYALNNPSTYYQWIQYAMRGSSISKQYIWLDNLDFAFGGKSGGDDYNLRTNNAHYMKITNCDFRYSGADNIYFLSSYALIQNCNIYESVVHGVYFGAYSPYKCYNNIFEYNNVWNNYYNEIDMMNVNQPKEITGNHHIRFNRIFETSGRPAWATGSTWGSSLIGSQTTPLTKIFIYGNIYWKNKSAGIGISNYTDSIFIFNNVFANTQVYDGIFTQDFGDTSHVWIYNNIFYNNGLRQLKIGNGDESNKIFDYNLYYFLSNYLGEYLGTNYSDLNSWRTITGQDINSIQADPLFVDPTNGDFRLQSTSPARDAGTDLGQQFNIDILGILRPQGGGWDMGAYEYFEDLTVDTIPPRIISAALVDSLTLDIIFSELLDEQSATNIENYSIDNGISIISLSLNNNVVRLNTSIHLPGFYSVTVNNVTDLAGNQISGEHNIASYGYNPDPLPSLLKFQPIRSNASSIPQSDHTPDKTHDGLCYNSGDPNSRWAADGLPQWIVYDLGDVKVLNKIRVQFYRWLEGRIYTYSILSSVDSLNWTLLRQNIQSQNVEWNEENFEAYPARYVKILITGNNENDWANIWEIEIYGNLMVSDNDDKQEIPNEFKLEQNYPNPFNPITTIRWQSPLSSHQTIKVYDLLGNEIKTLVDEYRQAGHHHFEFYANDLSSGIYIYRLQVGSYIDTKKMLLLK